MSKDGKKPLGDSSVFQKGRKGAMRVIYDERRLLRFRFWRRLF